MNLARFETFTSPEGCQAASIIYQQLLGLSPQIQEKDLHNLNFATLHLAKFILEVDGEIIATGSLDERWKQQGVYSLENIAVKQSRTGCGYGANLLEQLELQVQQDSSFDGAPFARVDPMGELSTRFYQTQGYLQASSLSELMWKAL